MDGLTLFLSYNGIDRRPLVIAVLKLLEARGITTFLDRDRPTPGLPWPIALEQGLRGMRAGRRLYRERTRGPAFLGVPGSRAQTTFHPFAPPSP